MTLKFAIIADDLTGSLDTGTPFVASGLSVAVAIDLDALGKVLEIGTDVVVVNTASRGLTEEEAASRVRAAAEILRAAGSAIIMKKIDSRLKGNVAAESIALADVLGLNTILVAPAVPDQERITYQGCVVGRGVEHPLPIASLFARCDRQVNVADAKDDAALDRIVAENDWLSTLAVGARGLSSAFARRLGGAVYSRPPFQPRRKTLFALGSRDPITASQLDCLERSRVLRSVVEAPMGTIENGGGLALPALIRCTGEIREDAVVVASRFAQGVKSIMDETHPDMLLVGGGDTAFAVFRELGVTALLPKGEIEAGIPWFDVMDINGRQFQCAAKSGGFGNSDSLLRLIVPNHAA